MKKLPIVALVVLSACASKRVETPQIGTIMTRCSIPPLDYWPASQREAEERAFRACLERERRQRPSKLNDE